MHGFYQTRFEDFVIKKSNNNCYPPHLHKQIEIIYVINGSIEVTINGNCKLLNSGDISICFPHTVHSTNTPDSSSIALIIFDSSLLNLYTNELTNMYPSETFIDKKFCTLEMQYALNKMLDYSAVTDEYRSYVGYLYNFISGVIPYLNLKHNIKSSQIDSSRLILEYINDNFTDNISLDSLSHELNMSKYYISHIFSQKIKISFPEYLNRCRIDYSRFLLKSTNNSITDIAFQCGFNSCRTFFRVFKFFYQITPKEYRSQ